MHRMQVMLQHNNAQHSRDDNSVLDLHVVQLFGSLASKNGRSHDDMLFSVVVTSLSNHGTCPSEHDASASTCKPLDRHSVGIIISGKCSAAVSHRPYRAVRNLLRS